MSILSYYSYLYGSSVYIEDIIIVTITGGMELIFCYNYIRLL